LRKHGKKLVGWDEILQPDLPTDSVIHSWRGPTALAAAASRGYFGILFEWLLYRSQSHAAEHYLNDPLPASDSTQRRANSGASSAARQRCGPNG